MSSEVRILFPAFLSFCTIKHINKGDFQRIMTKTLGEISNGDIENGLEPLLKNVRTSPSKFSVRQAFINVLKANEVPLSKDEVISIYVGDDKDEYSKRINKFMLDKGYILSTHSYDKL
jgi:hypothetical protein